MTYKLFPLSGTARDAEPQLTMKSQTILLWLEGNTWY